jgi:hypothetical protein
MNMFRVGWANRLIMLIKAVSWRMGRLWLGLALSWGGLCMAQSADSLMDFSLVKPPQAEKIKLVQPVVSWLVRADASQYCEKVPDQDGFSVWQEGCVHWSKSQPSCTIVTTSQTTHSLIGRLFMYCMHAGEPS